MISAGGCTGERAKAFYDKSTAVFPGKEIVFEED